MLARTDSWTLENVQERLLKMEEVVGARAYEPEPLSSGISFNFPRRKRLFRLDLSVPQARNERREALSLILQERPPCSQPLCICALFGAALAGANLLL